MKKKEIASVVVSEGQGAFAYRSDKGKFEWFTRNGEMAPIDWIRFTTNDGIVTEINTKYVSEIQYKKEVEK